MKYIYFDMHKTAIAADKIHKIVLDADSYVNFYYENEVIIVDDIVPDPKEFFLEGEEVDENILDDWFRLFCGAIGEYHKEKYDCSDSIHNFAEEASRSLFMMMDGWRVNNPELYKSKCC